MAVAMLIGILQVRGEGDVVNQTGSVVSPTTGMVGKVSFGAGCFWCVEAVLEHIPGDQSVISGFPGRTDRNPTYKQVCTGETGHAEVVQVTYDPAVLPFGELLDWFWRLHDPTTLNRQGADAGTQYRSVIFCYTDAQRLAADASKQALVKSGQYGEKPIVTEILPAPEFYPAEDYHQDYFEQNADAPYCRIVIQPKLKKLGIKP